MSDTAPAVPQDSGEGPMSTTHAADTVSTVDHSVDQIVTTAGQKWAGVVRILLGFTFLWAFVDKTFGLGFATTKAWLFKIFC